MTMETNGLNTKAMLVTLSISMWRCRKRDKKVTKETAERYGTIEKAGNYNKNLLPVEDGNAYQGVENASSITYEHFRKQTLPWIDDGTRILSAANYMHFTEILRKDRAAFESAVVAFKGDLAGLIARAETVLGPKLFHKEDYPTADDVEKRFSFSMKVLPLPAATDFRVDLNRDDVESIQNQIKQDTHDAIKEAVFDLYRRLHKQVSNIHEALTSGGVIKASTLRNLSELCELLPRLNLTNDPALKEIQEQIETALGSYQADDLSKKNKSARRRAAKDVEKIQSDLTAFMGGGK